MQKLFLISSMFFFFLSSNGQISKSNRTKAKSVTRKEITKSQLIGKWVLYNYKNILRPKEFVVFSETEYREYHNDFQQWWAPYSLNANVLTTTDAEIPATQIYKLILKGDILWMDSEYRGGRYKRVVQ